MYRRFRRHRRDAAQPDRGQPRSTRPHTRRSTNQQAVALRVEGDRFVGNRIRLIGNQDTLLADTPKPTTRIRQYDVDSYIEGDVDYVFGAANAVFDRVTFRSLDRSESRTTATPPPRAPMWAANTAS